MPLPLLSPDRPIDAASAIVIYTLAYQIANRAVLLEIESEGYRIHLDGGTWWDTRPMLDVAIQGPAGVDLHTESLAFAITTRIVERHPEQAHLVRIVNRVS